MPWIKLSHTESAIEALLTTPETVWMVYTINDAGNPEYLRCTSEKIARIVCWGLRLHGYTAECLTGTKRKGAQPNA